MRLQRINAMQNLCARLPLRQRRVMGKFAETAAANLFIQSSICAEAAIVGRDVERFVAVSRRCHHAGANAPHARL
jgi:nitrite reductase/ring-hydroxylating ferredoxin subunit